MSATESIGEENQDLNSYLSWCIKVINAYEPYRPSCESRLNYHCLELHKLYQENLSVEDAVKRLKAGDQEHLYPCIVFNIPCNRCQLNLE